MTSPDASLRVLIVEIDAAVRQSTELLLRVDGYRVATAATLVEALQYVRLGNDIDLVVSDHHPGDNETGIQVINALRAVLGKPVPAILMTRDVSAEIQQLAHDHDVRIVIKPFMAEELLLLLGSL